MKVKADADARITYKPYAKRDFRYVSPSSRGEGNCAVYAMTMWVDATRRGLTPEQIVVCHTKTGDGHAYVKVGEWALDNRFRNVIHINQQDCK